MPSAHDFEMRREFERRDGGQHRPTIAVALPRAHGDLVTVEVEILDPQTQHLEQPEPAAVEQEHDQALDSGELSDELPRLVARQHDRQALRSAGAGRVGQRAKVDPQDLAVEEEERGERLILGRGGDAEVDGEGGEEGADRLRAELGRVALAVEEDVAADPAAVSLLGPRAVVADAQRRPHAVQQPRRGRSREACAMSARLRGGRRARKTWTRRIRGRLPRPAPRR